MIGIMVAFIFLLPVLLVFCTDSKIQFFFEFNLLPLPHNCIV